ncbi:TPA: hypothetical protein NID04_000127 [Pseudomonas aeruginosa]|nr:hypothetical protein [Pseudomonas aeruginosa]
MEKQSVYTHRDDEDIGAFREDALSADDAVIASSDASCASQIEATISDLLDGMRRQSMCASRRKEVGSRLL